MKRKKTSFSHLLYNNLSLEDLIAFLKNYFLLFLFLSLLGLLFGTYIDNKININKKNGFYETKAIVRLLDPYRIFNKEFNSNENVEQNFSFKLEKATLISKNLKYTSLYSDQDIKDCGFDNKSQLIKSLRVNTSIQNPYLLEFTIFSIDKKYSITCGQIILNKIITSHKKNIILIRDNYKLLRDSILSKKNDESEKYKNEENLDTQLVYQITKKIDYANLLVKKDFSEIIIVPLTNNFNKVEYVYRSFKILGTILGLFLGFFIAITLSIYRLNK